MELLVEAELFVSCCFEKMVSVVVYHLMIPMINYNCLHSFFHFVPVYLSSSYPSIFNPPPFPYTCSNSHNHSSSTINFYNFHNFSHFYYYYHIVNKTPAPLANTPSSPPSSTPLTTLVVERTF